MKGIGNRIGIRRSRHAAATLLVALPLAGTIATSTAAMASAQPVTPSLSAPSMVAMAVAPGTNIAWAVGTQYGARSETGVVWTSNGGAWTEVSGIPQVPGGTLDSVSALSPRDVWVGGESYGTNGSAASFFLVWNGLTWRTVTVSLPPTLQGSTLGQTSVLGADDIWAVASRCGSTGCLSSLVHFNGSSWSQAALPLLGKADVVGLSASSAADVWVTAGTCVQSTGLCGSAFALVYNGTWRKLAIPGRWYSYSLLTARNPADVWVADSEVARYNGARWIVQSGSVSQAAASAAAIAPFGAESAWLASRDSLDTLMRFNGTAGARVILSMPGHSPYLAAATAASPASAWVLGSAWIGQVCKSSSFDFSYHWNGSKWLKIAVPLTAPPVPAVAPKSIPSC